MSTKIKPLDLPAWGVHNWPAFSNEHWQEAQALVKLRLQITAPNIPDDVWDKALQAGDSIAMNAMIEIAVELAEQQHIPIIGIRQKMRLEQMMWMHAMHTHSRCDALAKLPKSLQPKFECCA